MSAAVFLVWGFARIGVCWGRYGWLGTLFCHSQWAVAANLLLGVAAFATLAVELSIAHRPYTKPGTFHRTRAAVRGYRQLQQKEFRHVTAAMTLLAISLCAFLWLLLFSPVRF